MNKFTQLRSLRASTLGSLLSASLLAGCGGGGVQVDPADEAGGAIPVAGPGQTDIPGASGSGDRDDIDGALGVPVEDEPGMPGLVVSGGTVPGGTDAPLGDDAGPGAEVPVGDPPGGERTSDEGGPDRVSVPVGDRPGEPGVRSDRGDAEAAKQSPRDATPDPDEDAPDPSSPSGARVPVSEQPGGRANASGSAEPGGGGNPERGSVPVSEQPGGRANASGSAEPGGGNPERGSVPVSEQPGEPGTGDDN